MKKVLVTGGSGMLGANLLLDWQDKFSLASVQLNNKVNFKLYKQAAFDLSQKDKTTKFVQSTKPDAVVHTAAMVNVDYCESHRKEAFKANVEVTGNVAEAAEKAGAKIIYISTDSVFDGTKGNYDEEAKPNPLNVYAESKLAGEKEAMEKNSNAIIARTTIFGWNAQNKQSLSEWMYYGLKNGEERKLFKDMFFTPIIVNNLGRALAELIEKDFSGTINIAGSERLSKLNFGEKLADVFGFDKSSIVASTVAESSLVAKRPLDASLDISKARKMLETKLLDAESALEEKKRLLEESFVARLKEGFGNG